MDRNGPGSAILSSNSYSEGGLATAEPRWENSSDGLFQQSGKMCGEGHGQLEDYYQGKSRALSEERPKVKSRKKAREAPP